MDNIPAELIKREGRDATKQEEYLMGPIYKNKDNMECENYKGNTIYNLYYI